MLSFIPKFIKPKTRKKPVFYVETLERTMDDIVELGKSHDNNVILHRFWTQESEIVGKGSLAADAVLNLLAKIAATRSIFMINDGQFVANYTEKPIALDLTNKVSVQITHISFRGNDLSSITLVLTSSSLTASQLTEWLKLEMDKYSDEQLNQYSDKLCYFENKPPRPNGDPRGFPGEDINEKKRMTILTAPKTLTFNQYKFNSNKTFANIYGEQAHIIERRVRFFLENKQWYDSKGIPYQLGLMLTGIPGSGKTSIIRAIANLSKRHIISVNCANIQTSTQFKNLFFNEELAVQTSENTTSNVRISMNKRIYVLEEIDAMGDVVHKRSNTNNHTKIPDELTLADILTTFDGTMEVSGRILIVTTNHPELLDDALMRPGRIDYCANFGYASKMLMQEMYESFFDSKVPDNLIDEMPENVLSPAEVSECFFKEFTSETSIDPKKVIAQLNKLASTISNSKRT